MTFRGVMNDSVVPRNKFIKQMGIANIPNNELYSIFRKTRDILRIAGIRQLVKNRNMNIRMILNDVMNEVAADKTATTCNDNVFRIKIRHNSLFRHIRQTCKYLLGSDLAPYDSLIIQIDIRG